MTVGIIVVLAGTVGVVIWQAAQQEATQAGADPGNLTPVAYTNGEGGEGEVQGFARRQPAAFVGVAFVAGFALARLGKLVAADVSRDDLPTLPEITNGQG